MLFIVTNHFYCIEKYNDSEWWLKQFVLHIKNNLNWKQHFGVYPFKKIRFASHFNKIGKEIWQRMKIKSDKNLK